ncbi:divergent polysaccharide deacetylase [Sinorhizobium medicae]|nr:divergent polysaccharide deacetylase [Sinorhizobium medicae]
MNYLGGRFLSNADALEPVMRDLGKRGLLFLDDGTSAQSLSGTLAGAFDVPHGFADVVLDSELSRSTILRRLDDLERIARKGGTAIGVASAFDESVTSIAEWIEEAGGRGIEVVGVAALVKDPKHN